MSNRLNYKNEGYPNFYTGIVVFSTDSLLFFCFALSSSHTNMETKTTNEIIALLNGSMLFQVNFLSSNWKMSVSFRRLVGDKFILLLFCRSNQLYSINGSCKNWDLSEECEFVWTNRDRGPMKPNDLKYHSWMKSCFKSFQSRWMFSSMAKFNRTRSFLFSLGKFCNKTSVSINWLLRDDDDDGWKCLFMIALSSPLSRRSVKRRSRSKAAVLSSSGSGAFGCKTLNTSDIVCENEMGLSLLVLSTFWANRIFCFKSKVVGGFLFRFGW